MNFLRSVVEMLAEHRPGSDKKKEIVKLQAESEQVVKEAKKTADKLASYRRIELRR